MNAIVKQQEDAALVEVLRHSLYPGAQRDNVLLVLDYCRAANLDPMQKPVHIVPMWDSKAGQMRDVIMPGIGMYRVQASRTGQHAGTTEPEFGPMIEEVIGGATIRYPEWCRVTVKRALSNGLVADYTATEYWLENYAIKGGKEKSIAPNAMWSKRPRGQLAKCAEAQALRKAFPELGSAPTAEEMEGKTLQADQELAPPQIDAALLKSAEDAADKGVKAYQTFWETADKAQRVALKGAHESLKKRAERADFDRTIDEPGSEEE